MTARLIAALHAAVKRAGCWLLDNTTERAVTRFPRLTGSDDD